MAPSSECYTYRSGKKVALSKSPGQLVVRVLPESIKAVEIVDAEQVSSASTRVTCRVDELENLMTQARHLAPTHHAYAVVETGEEFLITDRVFITFKQGLSSTEIDTLAGKYGLVKKQAFSNRDFLFQLTDHTGMNPVKLVVKLNEEEENVESAEHDLNHRPVVRQPELQLPTDPSYTRQWHLHDHFQDEEFDVRSSARCEDAWQALGHLGREEVVIGVTDDGCRLDHPDFDSPNKFAGWGYMEGGRLVIHTDIDASGNSMYQAGANHGTACAGVIAGEVDGLLTVGAAPECRLLPIKWQSSGPSLFISDSKMLTVLNYIADKVEVLSNSWGSSPRSNWPPMVVNRIRELAQSGGRRGKGILFLWAAGNENCPIDHVADQDVPFTSGWEFIGNRWIWVGVKTAQRFEHNLVGISGVMHVAALASNAKRSHYSNYGTGIDVCAPTSNVHKYHRLSVDGLGITTTTGELERVRHDFGGTSSATPLVAGVAALAISANPDLTAVEVISLLKRTASKDLNMQGYARTPPANFDPNPTWDVSPIAPFDRGDFQDIGHPDGTWSPWFGHGKVDALAVVTEILAQPTPTPGPRKQLKSAPNKKIPDAKAAGLKDTIQITESGTIKDVKVTLDITHTWIGDLKIRLTSPGGTVVLLHNRAGANQDNIQRTYDVALTPSLGTLRGESITGDWTLHVQDLATADIGNLNEWTLDMEISGGSLIVEDSESVLIPDKNPDGITRSLTVSANKTIKNIVASVDITHTWIGDLRVTLTSPDGTAIHLHNRQGGSADNLVKTWRSQGNPALQAFRGKKSKGEWKLQVVDLAQQDVGKLNRWSVEIIA